MMRTGWILARVVVAVALAAPAVARGAGPHVTARAAIVMDAASGRVLWERNGSRPLPPASTTKVVTAIVALESGRLSETFRVSAAAADTAPSSIRLRAGQRMKLRDLLYALMLKSANDAAEVIAEGLAGSKADFGRRMTARARALGARTARFENPHGLTAPGHVASARDLAVLFRHALGLRHFREIMTTRSTRVPVQSRRVHWVSLHSHNRLLTGHVYPVIGKTGYTRAAGRCFVGAASHGGREVIIALLGSSDLWGDAKRLLAFGLGERAGRAAQERAPEVAEGDDEAADDPRLGRYAIRIGPFATRRAAQASRLRLVRHGYKAVMAGRSVQVGSFKNHAQAEQVASRLRRSGYHPIVVLL